MQSNALKRLSLCLIPALTLAGCAERAGPTRAGLDGGPYDLWIRNGTVIDGTGAERFAADVLVRDEKIVFVGSTDGEAITSKRTIDATGRIVAPGFVDLHSHGDPIEQSFMNFLAQGYTTVVLGQDGRSAHRGATSLDEWFRAVEAKGSEVNILVLTGHGSLRQDAGVPSEEQPTAEQLEAMQDALRADMDAGAFGMSFGLEYEPGRYSRLEEQKALGGIVGEYGAVVMSHMRSEDTGKIAGAIDELLAIDAHVHVSHMKIVAGVQVEEARAVLDQMARARAAGKKVTGDVYPYLASASNLMFLYPDWAKLRPQYDAAVRNRRAELEAHMQMRVEERGGPERILITGGPHAGKNVAELARELDKPYVKVMIDELGYGGPPQAHFLMAQEVHEEFMRGEHISISTDGAPNVSHPRSAGSTVLFLTEQVGEPPKLSLEQAIHKLSGLPAVEVLGLKDRGVIAAGQAADIVVFTPGKLHNRATWSQPLLPPEGFDAVVVNGAVALENGTPGGGRYGRTIRRSSAIANGHE
jgi:N-acyl-D-amino-acid deacylase